MRRSIALLTAVIAVVFAAVAVAYPPATLTSTDSTITVAGLDCATNYQIRVRELINGVWTNSNLYQKATTACADPSPTPTTTPTATPTATTTPDPVGTLPHDPSFVGPSYYAKWSNGPSTSMDYFPVLAYHMNLNQWSQLPARLKGAGVNGIKMAYDQSDNSIFATAAANGLSFLGIASKVQWDAGPANRIDDVRTNSQVATAYDVSDEPNKDGSPYAKIGSPSTDSGAQLYVTNANEQRSADPTRPVTGNFTKDVEEWNNYGPTGWTAADVERHNRTMMKALDITSADVYAWVDEWEWKQADAANGDYGTRHVGAWVYGHTIDRLRYYNPDAPAYGFVEATVSGDCSNTMMPGMIESAVFNIVAHGGRGYTIWPRDFCGRNTQPYTGATFTGTYSVFGDHLWDTQYARFASVNATIRDNVREINSPTISGVSAVGQNGIPVTALGKDVGGKLWLLAQADGNASNPLSNRSAMTGTITLPDSVPAGTILNVKGENRTVTVNSSHQIVDTFGTTTETPPSTGRALTYGYDHHIYAQA